MGILTEFIMQVPAYWGGDFVNFRHQITTGRIKVAAIKPKYLVRTYCLQCDEPCNAIKYKGERILLVAVGDRWVEHQCPPAVEPRDIDQDEPQRDGSGELV